MPTWFLVQCGSPQYPKCFNTTTTVVCTRALRGWTVRRGDGLVRYNGIRTDREKDQHGLDRLRGITSSTTWPLLSSPTCLDVFWQSGPLLITPTGVCQIWSVMDEASVFYSMPERAKDSPGCRRLKCNQCASNCSLVYYKYYIVRRLSVRRRCRT